MKVTFLGTGTSQGIPVIGSQHPVCLSDNPKDKRLRVSVLVEWDEHAYVIDCGPDFRYQMLRANVQRIDGILFTHEHSDHVAGLDDIRPFFYRQGDIPMYANQQVWDAIHTRFAYFFETENKYPGAPTVVEHVIDDKPFMLKGMTVLPIKVNHNFIDVYGFRFRDFVYITDAKTVADQEIEKVHMDKQSSDFGPLIVEDEALGRDLLSEYLHEIFELQSGYHDFYLIRLTELLFAIKS